jgi:hypothetical protein
MVLESIYQSSTFQLVIARMHPVLVAFFLLSIPWILHYFIFTLYDFYIAYKDWSMKSKAKKFPPSVSIALPLIGSVYKLLRDPRKFIEQAT